MNIIIVGAGFTGVQLAKNLINEHNQVTLIDNDEDTVRHAGNQLDCIVIHADGNKLETLEDVGIAKADALVCVTKRDEVNMITCSLVDAVYPNVKKIARVRNYAYYINSATAKAKHEKTFSANSRPLYGIDFMIHPDVEAADAIIQAVQHGSVTDSIGFDNTDLQLVRMSISEDSKLCGKQIKDIRSFIDCPFLIAYIVESDEKTSLPSGNTELIAGTSVGILVKNSDTAKVLNIFSSKQRDIKKIVIVGAGKIASIILERLIEEKKNQSILSRLFKKTSKNATKNIKQFALIDSDEELTKEVSADFASVKVHRADATDENFLREEGIVSYDLAICITRNNEMNMVLAAYLESLGVGHSISLVANSAFATIARKLGVDVPIPMRDVVVDSIMSHLRGDAVKEIHTLATGDMEIIETELQEESEACGKTLREVSTHGAYLVLMHKPNNSDGSYVIPSGNTKFAVGDHVVIITDAEQTSKALAVFGNA